MGANAFNLLLLLAVFLAVLGAIQCPNSPTRPRSPMRKFGDAIARKFSRSRNRNNGDGSDSDKEQPVSGEYSGGRLPRSRSPSPSRGGGPSTPAGIHKVPAGLPNDRMPNICKEVNQRGAAHVVNDMQMTAFVDIIRLLRTTAADDQCRTNPNNRIQSIQCQEAFREFKKIPPQYRGECSDAVSAQCTPWQSQPVVAARQNEKVCTFFIYTGQRTAYRMDGFYASLTDCVEAIKRTLFMDHQMSRLGTSPPTSPPQPL